MMGRRFRSCIVLACALGGAAAHAQPLTTAPAAAGRVLPAVRLDGSAVKIDGLLSEPTWLRAAVVTDMTRVEPVEGGPGFGHAEWRVFYDADALFIGVRVYQPPGVLRAHMSPRDGLGGDDSINIYLNPMPSVDTGYVFRVNPYGVQRDIFSLYGDDDPAWDGIWQSAGQRYPDGYSVEVRIPFRSLRFPHADRYSWGLGLGVYTASRGQIDLWPAISADRGSEFTQLGNLDGITGVRPTHNLELIPSLTFRYGGSADSNGTFRWDTPTAVGLRQKGIADAGLDVRYGISSGVTASLTVNPDFSQIEADASQLTYDLRYPLLLPEKRVFFYEGLDNFATPVSLLYTRAINQPAAGLKVAGKEGHTSLGILSAWDLDPPPSRIRFDPSISHAATGFDDMTGKDAITSIARVSQDVADGARIGFFGLAKQAIDRAGRLAADHELLALDSRLTLSHVYQISLQAGASRTTTAAPATSAPAVVSDVGAATSPSTVSDGNALVDTFYFINARRVDRRWLLELETANYGTDFRAESSAISRVGYRPSRAAISYKIEVNGPRLQYILPRVDGNLVFGANNDRQDWAVTPSLYFQLKGNTGLTGSYAHGDEFYNGKLWPVRLGTLSLTSAPWSWILGTVQVTSGKRINYDPVNTFLGQAVDLSVGLTFRPSSMTLVDVSYIKSIFWVTDVRMPVANVDLARLNVTYHFTMRWSTRLIAQLDTFQHLLAGNLLLAYEYRPGTVFYAGYEDSERLVSPVTPSERKLFVKFSYAWSL